MTDQGRAGHNVIEGNRWAAKGLVLKVDCSREVAELEAARREAPWAYQLSGLIVAAEEAARTEQTKAALFFLGEQIALCLARGQDVDVESCRLVLGVVWDAAMEYEAAA